MKDPNFDTASHMSVHDTDQDSFEEECPCEDALEIQKSEGLTTVRICVFMLECVEYDVLLLLYARTPHTYTAPFTKERT